MPPHFWLNAVHTGKAIIKIITHSLALSIDIAFIKINHASDLKPVQVFQEKRIGLTKVDQAFN
jgi:hypothetical protein